MNKYDNYNPSINDISYDVDETPANEVPSSDTTGQKRGKKSSPQKNKGGKDTRNKKGRIPSKEDTPFWPMIIDWCKSQTVRWIVATALFLFAAYLAISFVSYVVNIFDDQSEVANVAVGTATNIKNSGGEGGARISEILIDQGFGIGALVIVFWLVAISLKLYGSKIRFKTLNFTIKCLVALIAISLIVGLTTIAADTTINLGGYHGRYVNEFIIRFLGWPGAFILALFACSVFVILCMRDLILWIIKMKRAADEKRRIIAEEKAAKRKREKEIEEMELLEREEELRAERERREALKRQQEAEIEEEEPDDETYELAQENQEEIVSFVADRNTGNQDQESVPVEYDLPDAEEFADEEPSPTDEDEDEKQREMVVKVNTIAEGTKSKRPENNEPESHKYKFPPYELLREGEKYVEIDEEEQRDNEERIREALLSFGINITSITATVGPTVTLYEIIPDKGVKISAIRNLVDDIALRLSASGVRIIAPMPGKGTVGIEVPNLNPQTVSMRTVIKSRKYQESKYKLPLAIGSTISNEVYIADLAKMPHLLVAGATGQGKSVGMNAIIASLLYSKKPSELKFVMIDPKCVEFSFYNKIEKHYLAKIPGADEPIITDMTQVVPVLSSLCQEMENRYQLLKAAGCKNIEEYNTKIKDKLLNPNDGHEFLPYIVLLVDEFADLMMNAGKEVEIPIARLAQKARAIGIHVIIATQRPSTDVITGIIKANFPARIAFRVTNGIDSKTILQSTAAQYLIGRGDMLISNNGELVRVQCAFIDTPEVEAICDYIERQPYGAGAHLLPEPLTGNEGNGEAHTTNNFGERDPLFDEIARMVVMSNTASTSSLQRRYSIGYARAGKIMDQMEAAGIVGASKNGQPRQVLVDAIALEDILAAN